MSKEKQLLADYTRDVIGKLDSDAMPEDTYDLALGYFLARGIAVSRAKELAQQASEEELPQLPGLL